MFLLNSIFFSNPLVEITLSNSTNVVIQSLFLSSDWTGPNKKRVIIPGGVTIGSTAVGTPAMRTGTGRGGELEIVILGSVQGAGGAVNSGVGGDAILFEQSLTTISGNGNVWAGGGGGGLGGTGGGGSYNTTVTEGPSYKDNAGAIPDCYKWYDYLYPDQSTGLWWNMPNNGSSLTAQGVLPHSATSWYDGSYYTYTKGAYTGSGNYYYIYRSHPVPNYTAGGNGGNGGVGQGYSGANATGALGAVGGTNAGAGGTGGTGGTWGITGGTGATGATGNYSSPSGGAGGGLAGYALNKTSFITNNFTGSILGRTIS